MSWASYHGQALEEIEETEREVEDTWNEAWLLLLMLSGRLRSRLAGHAARLDVQDRRAVRRFRAEAKRQAEELIRETERGILGRSSPANADPNTPTSPRGGGIQARAIRGVHRRTVERWSAMRSTAADDSREFVSDMLSDERRRRITVDPGADARGPVESPSDLPDGPRQIAAEVSEQATKMASPRTNDTRKALAEDLADVESEAALNPRRNVRYESERLVESIVGLTSRHGRTG